MCVEATAIETQSRISLVCWRDSKKAVWLNKIEYGRKFRKMKLIKRKNNSIQGLVGHDKEFAFYSKCGGK